MESVTSEQGLVISNLLITNIKSRSSDCLIKTQNSVK